MNIPDSMLSMFNARVIQRNGSAVVEIPEQELEVGPVQQGQVYRVALLPALETGDDGETEDKEERKTWHGGIQTSTTQLGTKPPEEQGPPVEEDDVREVEIEDLGEQGDGIARIGPGYVVFVPDTEVGDRVKIRITDARENFAFAEVVESL